MRRWSRSLTTVLATACAASALVAGVSSASAAPARPDLVVSLPELGPRNFPPQVPFVIRIVNRGTATATNIAVAVSGIPPTASDGFTIEAIRPGQTMTVHTRSLLGRFYIGQSTVTAREAERDANPANNTITGFRFLVG
ncbi:MAG: hypothetical protein NTW76_06310 [Corynebacteriales bacterium]|uniref:CARDB domain-containing protein n=1 Tax=Williamsia herbipolensis TaxID=1603258 RepID=A0AAU4JY63_9NOCA|nr:hypothetical protein [Williamsia herbipolensis]MCX6468911.1 hypothetical protein [Mycobacteriales bacterium]